MELDDIAKESDIILNLEPLNVIVDHRGYFLRNSSMGFNILKAINSKNIKILYDIYHMQIMEDNIIRNIEENVDLIGHIHIADVSGRHEPRTGELNFSNILRALEKIGYNGYIGFEYIPLNNTEASLESVKSIFKF